MRIFAFALAAALFAQQAHACSTSVVMYSQPGCPSCDQARAYFASRGIPLIEYDARPYRYWTPRFVVNGVAVQGFYLPRLRQLVCGL